MKRILKIVFISISVLIALSIVAYNIYAYKASLEYEDFIPPKLPYADGPKELIISLIGAQEYFTGYVNFKYLNLDKNKAEIKMRNNSIADDSIGDTEYYIIAQKNEKGWKIVEYKAHSKCARALFFNFWTTNACP